MRGRSLLIPFLVGALFPLPPATATCGGGGGGGLGGISGGPAGERQVYRVPWKVLLAGVPEGDLKLLWLPGSALEARNSDLLESRYLTLTSGQCVGFGLLPPENPVRTALVPTGSTVVLLDRDGAEITRIAAPEGAAKPAQVEKLLRAELDRRKKGLEAKLDDGSMKRKSGQVDAAAALYREVWQERCLFASLGKKAGKALEKLGHPVDPVDDNALLDRALPDLDSAIGDAVIAEIRSGLDAEARLALDEARTRYENAVRLDPNDAVALRYLGEFHRHHSGEWDRAKINFSRLLTLAADPVSRAVALHGLGKMTIHGGDFALGVALFEESLAAWPLPLTYRNLAVYWFSEQKLDRASELMARAVALAPDDPYNIIFAATYLVEMGRPDEARRIAADNADLLEASYNLAAIWAQLGEREKMLELLARHFFEYERFEAVRVREMREARDDFVFAQFHSDPAFVELTRGADADPDTYHRTR